MTEPASPPAADLVVEDNPEESRYEAWIGDRLVGIAEYELPDEPGPIIVRPHRGPARGRGPWASARGLARGALDDVRRRGLRLVADCPFIGGVPQAPPRVRRPDRSLNGGDPAGDPAAAARSRYPPPRSGPSQATSGRSSIGNLERRVQQPAALASCGATSPSRAHIAAERQAQQRRTPPRPAHHDRPPDPEQRERREARLQQHERRGEPRRADDRERHRRHRPDHRVAGPDLQQGRRVDEAEGDAAARPRAAAGGRRRPPPRRRAGPPTRRPPDGVEDRAAVDRERHEQPERDRRVEDVARADRVRAGELVRLVERAAGEPARGRVAGRAGSRRRTAARADAGPAGRRRPGSPAGRPRRPAPAGVDRGPRASARRRRYRVGRRRGSSIRYPRGPEITVNEARRSDAHDRHRRGAREDRRRARRPPVRAPRSGCST